MAPRRRGGRTWSSLSTPYKERLKRNGITRDDWYRGADLRAARSHQRELPAYAAPEGPVSRFIRGEGSTQDYADLTRWRRRLAPAWIPSDPLLMDDDTAAALSRIGLPPSQWRRVEFEPRAENEPWTMVVYPKRGYPIRVDIPGGGAKGSPAWQVLDWLADPAAYGTHVATPDYVVMGS